MTADVDLVSCLKELELAAEDVLSDRREIVDLDRKRQSNREGLRALKQLKENHWKGQDARQWVALGNTFFKLPIHDVERSVQEDQVRLDTQVNLLRSELKVKVNRLRDLEGQPYLKGFDLRALDRQEMEPLKQVMRAHHPAHH